MPAYKTIVLELLQDRPALHKQLAISLRACHLDWVRAIERAEIRRLSIHICMVRSLAK